MDVPQTGGHVLVFPTRGRDKERRQKWRGVSFLEIQQRLHSEHHCCKEGQVERNSKKE